MVFAATASAVVRRLPNGHRISLMLRAGARQSAPTATTSGGLLVAHGGPVLSATAPYLIFWTPSGHPIAAKSEGLLESYLSDVATASSAGSTTNVYSVLGQYGAPYS